MIFIMTSQSQSLFHDWRVSGSNLDSTEGLPCALAWCTPVFRGGVEACRKNGQLWCSLIAVQNFVAQPKIVMLLLQNGSLIKLNLNTILVNVSVTQSIEMRVEKLYASASIRKVNGKKKEGILISGKSIILKLVTIYLI